MHNPSNIIIWALGGEKGGAEKRWLHCLAYVIALKPCYEKNEYFCCYVQNWRLKLIVIDCYELQNFMLGFLERGDVSAKIKVWRETKCWGRVEADEGATVGEWIGWRHWLGPGGFESLCKCVIYLTIVVLGLYFCF